jgi:hypothetical protein
LYFRLKHRRVGSQPDNTGCKNTVLVYPDESLPTEMHVSATVGSL